MKSALEWADKLQYQLQLSYRDRANIEELNAKVIREIQQEAFKEGQQDIRDRINALLSNEQRDL